MDRVLRLALAVAVLVVALATVAVATGGDSSAALSPEVALDGQEARLTGIDGCYRRQLTAEGRVKVNVPDFCRNGMCRLNLLWQGEPIGALAQGLGWGADYVQFNRGWWAAGPAVAIAGWANPGDGLGRNGDGVSQRLFLGATSDGSFISLVDDDPPFETGAGKFVLELGITDPGDPEIHYVQFWACAMG